MLVRLVGNDDHLYPNFAEVMQWLADSNLLEMIIEKLSPSVGLCLSDISLTNLVYAQFSITLSEQF